MKNFKLLTLLMLLISLNSSCQKEFLEERPALSLLVPTTLSDLQALLDNTTIMNSIAPGLTQIATDEFAFDDGPWAALATAPQRNSYIWAADLSEGEIIYDWNGPYRAIFYTNVVLDGLDKLPAADTQTAAYRQVKGSALFFRGLAFFYLSNSFCKAYDGSAGSTPGIPMPLTADVNARYDRGTLEQTYKQLLSDLETAYSLLPNLAIAKNRPTAAAAAAILSRVYLDMGDYDKSLSYANACISQQDKLIDYNTFNTTIFYPFEETLPNGNTEILLFMNFVSYAFQGASTTIAAPELYNQYGTDDLRKTVFFNKSSKGNITYKGYDGITLPEVFLSAAECLARQGKLEDCAAMLNKLLKFRISKATFSPVVFATAEDALRRVLLERRKEMVAHGLRWFDIKRLNLTPATAITLNRTVAGKTYTLLPNDKKDVYPIPLQEISRHNIQQNER